VTFAHLLHRSSLLSTTLVLFCFVHFDALHYMFSQATSPSPARDASPSRDYPKPWMVGARYWLQWLPHTGWHFCFLYLFYCCCLYLSCCLGGNLKANTHHLLLLFSNLSFSLKTRLVQSATTQQFKFCTNNFNTRILRGKFHHSVTSPICIVSHWT